MSKMIDPSKSPSDEEINKVIFKFIGAWQYRYGKCHPCNRETANELDYTTSLDALIPVWEKLELIPCFSLVTSQHIVKAWKCSMAYYKTDDPDYQTEYYEDKSITKAASLATYKAVIELNNDQ